MAVMVAVMVAILKNTLTIFSETTQRIEMCETFFSNPHGMGM
jgi:hypothetical protein